MGAAAFCVHLFIDNNLALSHPTLILRVIWGFEKVYNCYFALQSPDFFAPFYVS
jgi:hypothetical protein